MVCGKLETWTVLENLIESFKNSQDDTEYTRIETYLLDSCTCSHTNLERMRTEKQPTYNVNEKYI